MERTIKLKVDTQTKLISHVTSASTLGELKNELPNINWKNTSIIDRASNLGLPLDNSPLPTNDCILFVMPMKSKSGAWINLSGKECKAEIKKLKEAGVVIPFNYTQATTERMNEFLKTQAPKKEKKTIAEKATAIVENKVVEGSTEIRLKPGTYTLIVEGGDDKAMGEVRIPEGYINMNILVDATTIDDIDAEYAALKKKL